MAHWTVRKVSEEVVDALKRRAAANSRSVVAEHRELPYTALHGTDQEFAPRGAALRQRLRSSVDSADIIRDDLDGAS